MDERFKVAISRLGNRVRVADIAAHIIGTTHGVQNQWVILKDFFDSPEYRAMKSLGDQLRDLLSEDAYVQRGDQKRAVSSFKEALDWLMEEAKRVGVSVDEVGILKSQGNLKSYAGEERDYRERRNFKGIIYK